MLLIRHFEVLDLLLEPDMFLVLRLMTTKIKEIYENHH